MREYLTEQMARRRREYENNVLARARPAETWNRNNPITRDAATRTPEAGWKPASRQLAQPVPGYSDETLHPFSAQFRQDVARMTVDPETDAALNQMWSDAMVEPRKEVFGWIREDPETGRYWLDRNVNVQLYPNGKGGKIIGDPPPGTKALAHTHNFYLSKDRDSDGRSYMRGTFPSPKDFSTMDTLGMPGIILGEYGRYYYGPRGR